MNGTQTDYNYKRYSKSYSTTSAFAASGTATSTHASPTTKLVNSNATFLTSGVRFGDVVTNTSDAGASATVVTVDSETQLTTTAVSGGAVNNWTSGNNYTIAPASAGSLRLSFKNKKQFARTITAYTNSATGALLRIFWGNNAATAKWTARMGQNTLVQLDPDVEETSERVIVELAAAGTASLSVSFENR